MRRLELPADLDEMLSLVMQAFKYPENPEWNLSLEEEQNMLSMLKTLKRVWPLLRLLGLVWPPARDLMLGYVWEEDSRVVASCVTARRGASSQWEIGNVAVLPEYRRRGLARQLVVACIDLCKQRGAQQILLDVIDGNVPAYALYRQLGFEHFAGHYEMVLESGAPPDAAAVPDGYAIEPNRVSDWRPRYELARRVTPASEQVYKPVTEDLYTVPGALIALSRLVGLLTRTKEQGYLVREASTGQVVAVMRYSAHLKPGDKHDIILRVDPAHGHLTPGLLSWITRQALDIAPGRPVWIMPRSWQTDVIGSAEALGFETRRVMHNLGLIVA
jgi:ribosomal protein S18 acetylase RimI-like enzyme